MISQSIEYLKSLQTQNGLFRASRKDTKTGYDRIWIRDNLYMSIAFLALQDKITVERIYHGLFHLFKKFEWKIDEVIKEKPKEDYKFLHPLYTEHLEETTGGWGWKQNDTIGGFLYFVSIIQSENYNIICSDKDQQILQKLINYLQSIKYWEDEDNGIWEQNKEIHASSVGACIAGLKAIKKFAYVPEEMIEQGEKTLKNLLPRESKQKKTDLALLSLIYPYNIAQNALQIEILKHIEDELGRKNGIIRYKSDAYYMEEKKEASWTMGFPWMAICYHYLNNIEKHKEYLLKTLSVSNSRLEMPELYIKDEIPNENTPLGWSQSLIIRAFTL